MPSTSKKQHGFMAAVASNPKFAKKVGVSSSVGKEFLTADKGKTFKEGGSMKKMNAGMMAIMAKEPKSLKEDSKEGKAYDKKQMAMKKGGMAKMAKMAKGGGIETKGKTKGKMVTMKKGGKAC